MMLLQQFLNELILIKCYSNGIFIHLKLCCPRDSQRQVMEKLFKFDKMEVNDFKILLIDVMFYLLFVKKLA